MARTGARLRSSARAQGQSLDVVHLPADRWAGRSAMAQAYAISNLAEAQAYLAHPVLGPRLVECAEILASHRGLSAEQIFGGIDAIKLRSSMTLLRADPDQAIFRQVIDQYFAGPDPETDRRI